MKSALLLTILVLIKFSVVEPTPTNDSFSAAPFTLPTNVVSTILQGEITILEYSFDAEELIDESPAKTIELTLDEPINGIDWFPLDFSLFHPTTSFLANDGIEEDNKRVFATPPFEMISGERVSVTGVFRPFGFHTTELSAFESSFMSEPSKFGNRFVVLSVRILDIPIYPDVVGATLDYSQGPIRVLNPATVLVTTNENNGAVPTRDEWYSFMHTTPDANIREYLEYQSNGRFSIDDSVPAKFSHLSSAEYRVFEVYIDMSDIPGDCPAQRSRMTLQAKQLISAQRGNDHNFDVTTTVHNIAGCGWDGVAAGGSCDLKNANNVCWSHMRRMSSRIVAHEWGHNSGYQHSGKVGAGKYDDKSCYMGSNPTWTGLNAVKRLELGFYPAGNVHHVDINAKVPYFKVMHCLDDDVIADTKIAYIESKHQDDDPAKPLQMEVFSYRCFRPPYGVIHTNYRAEYYDTISVHYGSWGKHGLSWRYPKLHNRIHEEPKYGFKFQEGKVDTARSKIHLLIYPPTTYPVTFKQQTQPCSCPAGRQLLYVCQAANGQKAPDSFCNIHPDKPSQMSQACDCGYTWAEITVDHNALCVGLCANAASPDNVYSNKQYVCKDSKGQTVADSFCKTNKPTGRVKCQCPTNHYTWVETEVDHTAVCKVLCDNAGDKDDVHRPKVYVCEDSNGNIFEPSFCPRNKPSETVKCECGNTIDKLVSKAGGLYVVIGAGVGVVALTAVGTGLLIRRHRLNKRNINHMVNLERYA